MANVSNESERNFVKMENLMMPESQYLLKRRNTEKIPRSLDPSRCRQDNHSFKPTSFDNKNCSCTKRRHTLAPGVSQKEIFEKETKLIVLEFLKACTPRLKFDEYVTESNTQEESEEVTKKLSNSSETPKHMKVTKRTEKKPRKVSGNQSKSVTLGAKDHQEIDEFRNRYKYQRSSSELTSQQYHVMKRKFEEMQLPIIQWLKEHDVDVKEIEEEGGDENVLIFPKITTTSENDVVERSSMIEHEMLLGQDPTENTRPRRPKGLTLNIPRRSIALQLIESNVFTPETIAVQRLERISKEIIRDYGDVLTSSMIDLLNPIKNTNSLTYDIFSKVAKKVYNFAAKSSSTLARLAMVLSLVKETMIKGNLNEDHIEVLVDHSTKFFTENADESPLKDGKGWVELGLNATNGIFPTIKECEDDTSSSSSSLSYKETEEDEDNVWAPYGIAAFTVGIGLAYKCMRT